MLSSAEEAEDAVQHTFMAAYRASRRRDQAIQLRPWLYTIARNRCLSVLRARRERPADEVDESATENLSAEAQRRQDVRELLADVAGLPEDQRAALVLAELGAVSHEEIAAGARRAAGEGEGARVPGPHLTGREPQGARHAVRGDPRAARELRGGALRRNTLHRHLRECAGCRAFREEVENQRKTLAWPTGAPTLGLKEAALGAAFGAARRRAAAAAAAAGGALAAKALVARRAGRRWR